jgi:hypothetical protein
VSGSDGKSVGKTTVSQRWGIKQCALAVFNANG